MLFGAKRLPSVGKSVAIGYYPRGCLSGGVELPINGPTWQVMRLSRNRNWGHPSLVRFIEKFAPLAAKATGWNGIFVGDMAQPRGGPAVSDHASHQTGLDVDIWFKPMPDHLLTKEERETISAINLVSEDWKHLNPQTWTPQHIAFIKTAAEQPEVERVLVNAAIKKELCRVEDKAHLTLDGQGTPLVRPPRPYPCAAEMPSGIHRNAAHNRRYRAATAAAQKTRLIGSRTRCCRRGSRGRRPANHARRFAGRPAKPCSKRPDKKDQLATDKRK